MLINGIYERLLLLPPPLLLLLLDFIHIDVHTWHAHQKSSESTGENRKDGERFALVRARGRVRVKESYIQRTYECAK